MELRWTRTSKSEPQKSRSSTCNTPTVQLDAFPGRRGYLSTSIEAYFALKLAGLRAGDEPMMQARRWILSKGGIENTGTIGAVLPGGVEPGAVGSDRGDAGRDSLLPNWFPFNIYELASWARGTLMG